MSEWNFPNKKYKCSHAHCAILDNRFSGFKKDLIVNFQKPSVKNFKIWLSSLKEIFLDVLSTINIHRNSLNFVFSKRGYGKMDSFLIGKIFPFRKYLPKRVCDTDWLYVLQTKFCIKICKKPPSWFFISYDCFILELRHSALLWKRFLSQIPRFQSDSLKLISACVNIGFTWM